MTSPSDTKYTGEWKDGQRHGQGTETLLAAKYHGEWRDVMVPKP